MNYFKNHTICITGAGSGIGRELACQFSASGAMVIICDYNAASLKETASQIKKMGGRYRADALDISNNSEVLAWAKKVRKSDTHIDILINNAGIAGKTAELNILSIEEMEQVINTNLWGAVYCTLAFLPLLRKSSRPVIVNVSSLAGLAAVLGALPYTISKFALRGFSEALRLELKEEKISVIQVHPGVVDTGIVENIPGIDVDAAARGREAFERQKSISGAKAAKKIIRGIRKSKKRILPGPGVHIVDLLVRIFPGNYDRLVYPKMKKIIDEMK